MILHMLNIHCHSNTELFRGCLSAQISGRGGGIVWIMGSVHAYGWFVFMVGIDHTHLGWSSELVCAQQLNYHPVCCMSE